MEPTTRARGIPDAYVWNDQRQLWVPPPGQEDGWQGIPGVPWTSQKYTADGRRVNYDSGQDAVNDTNRRYEGFSSPMDQRAQPPAGLAGNWSDAVWDTKTGEWKNKKDWGKILGTAAVVGGIAAPALIGAAGGGGAGAGAGSGGAGTAAGLAGVEGAGFGLTGAGSAGLAGLGTAGAEIGAGAGIAGGAGAASSLLPSSIIAPTSGVLPAGGTGLAAGAGTAGTLGTVDRITGIGKNIAPILGNAAQARSQNAQQNYNNDVQAERLKLQEPGIHLSNLAKTSAMAAGPVKANWGGPGSGLRGQTLSYTGGANAEQSPEVKAGLQSLIQKRLQEALAGQEDNPALNPQQAGNSAWDKILGGAALGSSILGGFRR